jgi:transposase
MRRYALRDDQWDRIKDILPGREGHVGVTAKDNRLFVEAVLYRYRAGRVSHKDRFSSLWIAR